MKKILIILSVILLSCEKDYTGCYECKTYLNGKEVRSFKITNPDAEFIQRAEMPVVTPEGTYTTKCEEI